jgi:2-oxoglutarate ferredoxin oxidoreductase subunit gamma
VLNEYDTAILLNQQSVDKFESKVKPGGLLIYDGNGITSPPTRKDITIFRVDAADEAARMSTTRTFNMIVLGGYLKVKPLVKLDLVLESLRKSLPARYHHLIPVNEEALKRGMEIIYEVEA